MLPYGWRRGTLGDVIADITTGVSVNGEDRPRRFGEIGVLKLSCVLSGTFDPSCQKTVIASDIARVSAPVTGNTILVSRANTAELVGASAYVPQSIPDLYLPDKLWQLSPTEADDTRWLGYIISDPAFRPKLAAAATGTSASMKNISQDAFLSLSIVIPPLAEQRRIAAILGTWDAAITRAERLLAAKIARRRQWQATFVLRSSSPNRPLGEIVRAIRREIPRPNKPYKALGIRSHGKGTFHRDVKRPNEVDMDTLFVVAERDLIINITFAWEGAVALAEPRDAGCLVSHRFPTFEVKEDIVNRDYLGYAINNRRFFYALSCISPGSAGRNRVLNQKDFLDLAIPIPPREQQDRIARLLNSADADIAATIGIVERLKRQRFGLMQKLLTGEYLISEAATAELSPAAD